MVDALHAFSRQMSPCNLAEEFLCAKVWPLWAGEKFFSVVDDGQYQDRGLKSPVLDVEKVWKKMFRMALSREAVVEKVYTRVLSLADDLVGKLDGVELAKIQQALDNRQRVNRIYDLLGARYPDWAEMTTEVGEGALGKRKRGTSGPKTEREAKRGQGHGAGSQWGTRGRAGSRVPLGASAATPIVTDDDARIGGLGFLASRAASDDGYRKESVKVAPECGDSSSERSEDCEMSSESDDETGENVEVISLLVGSIDADVVEVGGARLSAPPVSWGRVW